MNRREAFTSIMAAIAVPAMAQESQIITSGGAGCSIQKQSELPSREVRDKEYAICKLRGHTPTIFGETNNPIALTMQYWRVGDSPVDSYKAETSTGWQTCWYCKKQYRYVTKIEEKDAS